MGGDSTSLTSSRDDGGDDAPPSGPTRAFSTSAVRRAPSPEPQSSPRLFHVEKNVSATDNIFKKSEAAAASTQDADFGTGTLSRGGSSGVQVKKENCVVCGKSVYFSDKAVADGKVFHKTCLRCKECNKVLTLGNFSALEGTLYCKPHFLQLFKAKGGNYTEGFGLEDAKKNWAPLAAPAKFGGIDTLRKPLASSDPTESGAGGDDDDGAAAERAKVQAEERAKAQAEERERAKAQADERAKAQAQARAKAEAEAQARAKVDADVARARAEAERAKAEAERAKAASAASKASSFDFDAAAESQASAAEQRAQAQAAQVLGSAQQRLAEARRVLAEAEAAEAEAERRLLRADTLNSKAQSLEQRLAKAEAERDALKAEVERLKSATPKQKPALPVKSKEAQAAFEAIAAIDELDELDKLLDM
jgi:hypothetical protein